MIGSTSAAACWHASGRGGRRAPLLLMLTALRPNETLGAFGPRSLAMVLVHDLAAPKTLDPFVLGAAFELTPAEARVAVRVALGETVDEVAQAHGVAASTVRTQLREVFAKVGVNRQSELASALSRLPSMSGANGSLARD